DGDLPAARDRPSERCAVHRPHLQAQARHGGAQVQEAGARQTAQPDGRLAPRRRAGGRTMSLRVIFMGTPEFSATTLRAIAEAGHEIVAVYTQPPRPAGRRGLELTRSPVHLLADELGAPVR